MFKAVLLGEAGVGKSSIFLRLKENVFGERLQPTVGIESCSKVVRIDNQTITLSIWDTAGVERFKTITRNYYRNTHAVFLVFSCDNPSSLHYLSQWADDCSRHAPKALKFLIGNKTDLERLIPVENIDNFAAGFECEDTYFMSAKTGAGVDESFQRIGERLMDVFNTPLIVESHYNESIEITKFQPSRSGCCQ
ncbi:ras-related protein Rab-1-like [Ostrea edulis]|uniref:ras-related protein Rab-1-like n=1 Tax=Ostrea edulis TaxID=37623 RepID=UPI002095D3E1|nr:ras-related protein Rab-1-like [Ostrea edulis]